MKKFVLPLAIGIVATCVAVPLAVGGNGDATCPAATSAAHDLVVPAGATCTLNPGDTVGHDLVVGKGATLIDNGAVIGHDLKADKPAAIGIGLAGSVGHDIQVNGTTGATIEGTNYICNTQVGHDVTVKGSAGSAGTWFIGDSDTECPGGAVSVQHDLTVQDNKTRVDVSENGTNPSPFAPGFVGHDLTVKKNFAQTVEGNVVGHDATCDPTQTPADTDGDATPNVAGHNNKGCG